MMVKCCLSLLYWITTIAGFIIIRPISLPVTVQTRSQRFHLGQIFRARSLFSTVTWAVTLRCSTITIFNHVVVWRAATATVVVSCNRANFFRVFTQKVCPWHQMYLFGSSPKGTKHCHPASGAGMTSKVTRNLGIRRPTKAHCDTHV